MPGDRAAFALQLVFVSILFIDRLEFDAQRHSGSDDHLDFEVVAVVDVRTDADRSYLRIGVGRIRQIGLDLLKDGERKGRCTFSALLSAPHGHDRMLAKLVGRSDCALCEGVISNCRCA